MKKCVSYPRFEPGTTELGIDTHNHCINGWVLPAQICEAKHVFTSFEIIKILRFLESG
jgi:hypothetical protein